MIRLDFDGRRPGIDLISDAGHEVQDLVVVAHDLLQEHAVRVQVPDRRAGFADRRQLAGVAHEHDLQAVLIRYVLQDAEQELVDHRGFVEEDDVDVGQVHFLAANELLQLPGLFDPQTQEAVDRDSRAGHGAQDLRGLVGRRGEGDPVAHVGGHASQNLAHDEGLTNPRITLQHEEGAARSKRGHEVHQVRDGRDLVFVRREFCGHGCCERGLCCGRYLDFSASHDSVFLSGPRPGLYCY